MKEIPESLQWVHTVKARSCLKDLPTYERCGLWGKQALLPGSTARPWGSRLLGDPRVLPMRRPSSGFVQILAVRECCTCACCAVLMSC